MHFPEIRRVRFDVIAFAVAALALWGTLAAAHERHLLQIGTNDYLLVVGFLSEPVYTGDRSGLDLRVVRPDPSTPLDARAPAVTPVDGLDKSLKVEVKAGPHARVFDLRPTYGAPGRYEVVFYPTVATTYSFRLFGTLDTVPVDLTFACNPLGHVSVEDKNPLQLAEYISRKVLLGSFGCPTARGDVEFPPLSHASGAGR
jgi:hypothetical protein